MRKRNLKQICAQMLLFAMVFMIFVPVADAAALKSVNINDQPLNVITVNKVVMVKALALADAIGAYYEKNPDNTPKSITGGTMEITYGDQRLFVSAGTKYAYLTNGVGTESPTLRTVTLRIAPVTRTVQGAATLYVPYQDIIRLLGGTLGTNSATIADKTAAEDYVWDGTADHDRDLPEIAAGAETTFKSGGASFPNNLYQGKADAWVTKYLAISKDIVGGQTTYAKTSSGAGIDSVMGRTNDWAGSDDPLPAAEMNNYTMIPAAMGGVAIITNIQGIGSSRLNLTADIVADIYKGKITKWNDARIKAINPAVAKNLPGAAINVVYRAEASGTSYCFTSWLASAAPKNWTHGAQADLTGADLVTAPKKTGVSGGGTVVTTVAGSQTAVATTNAIGYVSRGDVTTGNDAQGNVEINRVKNRAGNYVLPTTSTVMAAGANATSLYKHPVDTTNPAGYPVVAFTWIIAEKNAGKAKADWTNLSGTHTVVTRPALDEASTLKLSDHKKSMLVLKDFVTWAVVEGFGDKFATDNNYVGLTPNLKAKIPAILDTIVTSGL
ncbi:substrate-binding domain-containing protein [Candidatus Formimonas warabiya]|uniref:PBP domain-containing protein n=1 Tax=Formimonas warabiya TaxID=1761012 RepID=A0A3G1KQR5_FORW1|nr:substrate-binding domain-containing protein [Candidatus Formimonas warabiya]ATW24786.1 hypothetical protein DCMF_08375 [Candidatus Formimonas warabiya]